MIGLFYCINRRDVDEQNISVRVTDLCVRISEEFDYMDDEKLSGSVVQENNLGGRF